MEAPPRRFGRATRDVACGRRGQWPLPPYYDTFPAASMEPGNVRVAVAPARRCASLPSGEAQWPLALPSYVSAAAIAAWEADAIEPDVASSLYASVQSSSVASTDSSDDRILRFRRLRVSLRRRPKAAFQYHVPVHRTAQFTASSSRHSTLLIDERAMGPTRRRASAAPPPAVNTSTGLSRRRSDGPWSKHALTPHEAEDQDDVVSPRDDVTATPAAPSRRHRAWTKFKAHAKLSRLKPKLATKATGTKMFSISFYPWKMEAHGYYSSPEAAVEWVPDTASARCQLCYAGFNLARRRHHCRLCGRLVCNECSLQRTFLPLSDDAMRRAAHRSLIKSGAPQRTCDSCASTLTHMVAQHDHRVQEVCVDVTEESNPNVRASLSFSSSRSSLHLHHSHHLNTRPRGLSKVRRDELDQVLRARAKSRASRSGTRQHIISSRWLEQWLQFVQTDDGHRLSSSSSSTASRGSMGARRRSSRWATSGRRPGPIANYELLDFVNGKLVARDWLQRSRGTESSGDFHVISHDVWRVFVRLYGGGPCITVDDEVVSTSLTIRDDAKSPVGGSGTSASLQWIITELDPTAAILPSNLPHSDSAKGPLPNGKATRVRPTSSSDLALRPPEPRNKASAMRPASTTALATPTPLSSMGRSTRELEDTASRRKSLISYLKKWRQGDDACRLSSSSTTISPVEDDGIVLFDPLRFGTTSIEDDESDDESDSSTHGDLGIQRETMAAVSAFAAAAAEARRKSTMSLMRHSTALTTRETAPPSLMTA